MSGTLAMARLVLRRDRVRMTIWTLALVAMMYSSAAGVKSLYPDPAGLAGYARTVEDNPAVVAFTGPTYEIDTLGGRIAFEASSQMAIAIGLMALLSMTRHTRAEEESGRAELLRSTPIGRHAGLTAALLVVIGTCLVIGAGSTLSLVATDLPLAGSLALGGAIASIGIFFAALGGLTAQVTERGRAASGLALAGLGVAFLLRAVGDTSVPALRWMSPIGIGQHSRAFAGERWWPLAILLAVSAALVAAAVALASRRDFGAGLVQPKPGPREATAWLGRPFGLALRLQRGVLVAWASGLFVFGLVMGAVAESAEELIGDNEQMRDILAQAGITDVVDSFLATILLMLALTACGFALQSALRLRAEEIAGRAELILPTGVSRRAWLGANAAVTALGTVAVLSSAGLGTGVSHALQTADAVQVPRLVLAGLVHAPAVLLLAGIGLLLFGVAPRATALVWAPLALAVVVGVFGELLRLPSWVAALSPFDHVPPVPARGGLTPAIAILAVLGAGTVAVGLAGYERRDVVP